MFPEIHQLRGGKSRQMTTFNLDTKHKVIDLKPGETQVVVDQEGPGIITRIWMTMSGWFWRHWEPVDSVDPSLLKKVILRIYWDGESKPSVEAPIGDFFGNGHAEYRHYMSKYIGMSSGGFYSYFPMPFNKVRIEIENLHETDGTAVFFNANYQELDEVPEDSGRFHCQFKTERLNGPDTMEIINTKGRGHFVGCSVSMQGKEHNYLSYLEAPEYVYIDTEDKETPTFAGTGGEDYFNGAWYFRDGEFDGNLHGVPLKDTLRSMITMYRFHDLDALTFDKSFRMTFESPWAPEHLKPFWYSSTAYYYLDRAEGLADSFPSVEELMSMYRVRDVDHQSIP